MTIQEHLLRVTVNLLFLLMAHFTSQSENQGVSQLDFIFLNAYALTHGKITPNRYSQPANAYHASWQ